MTDQAQVDALLTSRPEPKINGNSQYVIAGKTYTRCTTFIKPVANAHNIRLWEKRMVALGLADRPDILAAVGATEPDDKKRLDELCDQAKEAARGNARATIGTALHTYCEWHDLGVARNVPPPWDADVAAYAAAMDAAGIVVDKALIEGVLVNTTLGVAGRYDRLVKVPGIEGHTVLDLKSGDYLALPEYCPQLSIYAHSDLAYDPATDTTSPIDIDINKEVGVIVHLPAGSATCTIYTVDLTVGWEMAQTCKQIRSWWYGNKSRFGQKLAERVVAPSSNDERRAAVRRHLEHIRDFSEVALADVSKHWPQDVPTFKASETHTDAELDAIEAVLVEVGKRHQVPFPPAPEPAAWDGINTETKTALAQPAYVERSVVDALIARLKALPADALTSLTEAIAGKVPNLRTYRVEQHHVRLVEMYLAIAEKVDLLDPALVSAFFTYCRVSDVDAPSAEDVARVAEAAAAVERTLFFTIDADGWHVVERPAS